MQTTLEQKRKMEETRSPAPKEEENTNNTSQKDDMTDPDNDEYNMDNETVNDKLLCNNTNVLKSGHTNANLCEWDNEHRQPCIEEEIRSTSPASSSTILQTNTCRVPVILSKSTVFFGTENGRL